jgi:hypothetical protein
MTAVSVLGIEMAHAPPAADLNSTMYVPSSFGPVDHDPILARQFSVVIQGPRYLLEPGHFADRPVFLPHPLHSLARTVSSAAENANWSVRVHHQRRFCVAGGIKWDVRDER